MVKLLSSGAKHCTKFLGVGAEGELPSRLKCGSYEGSTLATRHFSSLRTSLAGFTKSSLGEYKVLGMMGLVRQTRKETISQT